MNNSVIDTAPNRRDDSSDTRIESLMRQLIEALGREPEPVEMSDEEVQIILLEMRLEGIRYILQQHSAAPVPTRIRLSPREQEIARLISKGYPNKLIALVLHIHSDTVSTHIRRIYTKLNVNSRAEMVTKALKSNLI